jgi:hypothetical protein
MDAAGLGVGGWARSPSGSFAAQIPVLVTRAADTPPREVFEHLALVGDRGDVSAAARGYAEQLAGFAGGVVTDAGVVTHCDARVLERASLVVFAAGHDRPSGGMADSVAKVLGACHRPVLFVPGD